MGKGSKSYEVLVSDDDDELPDSSLKVAVKEPTPDSDQDSDSPAGEEDRLLGPAGGEGRRASVLSVEERDVLLGGGGFEATDIDFDKDPNLGVSM